ncbi:MAG: S53 family peptidase [Candidatus Dormiibacterota bacterium]
MGKGWSRRLGALVSSLALVAGGVAVISGLPTGALKAVGPHMSVNLTALEGPEVTSLADGSIHHNCAFTPIPCYGPYDLAKTYDFPANLDGRGQTIVIVDAYGSPSILTDLAFFDAYFGIAAPPSLTIIKAAGTGATGSGALVSWQIETSLDVEYAHAMAPGANIVLAVAATDNNYDINAAEAQVFPHYRGAVVSQSFGDWETDATAGTSFADEHRIFMAAVRSGDTLLASAGDAGATWTQYTGTKSPAVASYPASDPLVTGVGGTQGNPYPGGLEVSGHYGGEATWNEPQFDVATGGAPSVLFRAPSWQRPVTGYRTRTVPDVAYNAALEGGVEVIILPHIYLVGGTSSGSPQWAAIFALANQARESARQDPLGVANATLYKLGEQQMRSREDGHAEAPAVFHDIVAGNNALDSTVGFAAKRGYDLATGWGTPDVANLVAALTHGRSDRGQEVNDPAPIHGSTSSAADHAPGTVAH